MYDLAALAIAAACFAVVFAIVYALERIWCRPPTPSVSQSPSPCSSISSTHSSAGSGS